MKKASTPPPPWRLWFQDNLGRVAAVVGVPAAIGLGVLVIAYLSGSIPEDVAGLTLAGIILLVTCGLGLRSLLEAAGDRRAAVMVTVLSALTLGVAAAPVLTTLLPGEPVAQGQMLAAGESLPLPAEAHGRLRILMHGKPAGEGPASVEVGLEVGSQSMHGKISRVFSQVRAGRRGGVTTVMRETDTAMLNANVPTEVDKLTVSSIDGDLAGPVILEVFPDWFPLPMMIGIAVALAAFAAVVASRARGAGSGVGSLGCALVFGIMASRIVTPDAAVKHEVGALVIGIFAGGLSGSALVWMARKIIAPRGASPAASAAR